MSYELIITEKPSAAEKIAKALANGKAIKETENGVPYYKITHQGKDIIVGCAVGHLYTVHEREKKGWTYPVFDVEWEQSSKVRKDAAYTSKYVTVLKKLSKDAKVFTVATDFDIEGEVIGLNILQYICKQKDGRRMKFSMLTKDELVRSYEKALPHLEWGQANAGVTRHVLDYYYGINLSRALSIAVKTTGAFKVLSAGRVQGPALKILVDREREIKAFVPEPFWEIELQGVTDSKEILAYHKKDKFWKKDEAEQVMDNVRGQKRGKVSGVEKRQFKQEPPHPFDLTTLQTEAYRSMRIQPKDTLAIAQELYINGLISYPRTSSQILPKEIEYKKILQDLSNQEYYRGYATELLKKKELAPNNGKKTDPAHPAIFPTGQIMAIEGRQARIYDIIVRRFLATFGEPAVRETMEINIDVNAEPFVAKGTRTITPGWHFYYGQHVKLEEEELPAVEKGQQIEIKKIDLLDKQTSPPKRYTPASIIKELERRNLGTKATRAAIVDALYQRGYVIEDSLQATEIGVRTCETLEKHCPSILDEELTRHFEEEMDAIREHKKKSDEILHEAKTVLTAILKDFKGKEKEIGRELADALKETRDEINFIGACQKCKQGTLQIRRGRFGRFIACNKYPECKTTFSLPATGMVKSVKKDCEKCGFPLINIRMARKRPQIICINAECPTKRIDEAKAKAEEKPCPKCSGKMVVRRSIYGSFLGCSGYPKCRYSEKLAAAPEEAASEEGEEAVVNEGRDAAE